MTSQEISYKALLADALQELDKMEAQLDRQASFQEPLALVGLACRFPGGADTPEKFWELLVNGVDAATEVPQSRWNIADYYNPEPGAPGKMYCRLGCFVDDVDRFDPGFFGISPREAAAMDPQQRLLLETTWEALERAGIAPKSLLADDAGVFVGMMHQDYSHRDPEGWREQITSFTSGNASSMAAGRLSYVLGVQGPSVTVDTACSSSLAALHLARQSLRLRECRLAIVAGVNLQLSPLTTIAECASRMLSPDGRCKTFDAEANGIVRGDGCGVVVLKRLSDALSSNDPILAVIRGSAMAHDGASGGLTVPNGPAQEKVLRRALSDAGVAPRQVSYIEAHGTGTSLGDPIEVGALGAVFGSGGVRRPPLWIGSVKTNIGHTEGAAGIAGLIKVVLALQHRTIPPHLHLRTPNPHVAWDQLPIEVVTETKAWTVEPREIRIAGVSSFGLSGSNAHVVVEEAPERPPRDREWERPVHLLTLSAKTSEALGALGERYRARLSEGNEPLGDVCFTANAGRNHFRHRLALMAANRMELLERLTSLTAEAFHRVETSAPSLAWLFSGQGSQYRGMSRQLYETHPEYRRSIDECAALLEGELDVPLPSLLWGQASGRLIRTRYTQPALCALEYALGRLWLSWGVTPDAVLGHSVGEYAAACLCGVFSLADALHLIAARGRLMEELCRPGAMLAILAEAERVDPLLSGLAVSVAAYNGPRSLVAAGVAQDIDELGRRAQKAGLAAQRLAVSHAFHSALMEPMLGAFREEARRVTYHPPSIAFISSATGAEAGVELADPEYWVRQVRSSVRYEQGLGALRGKAIRHYLEIGPGSTLVGMGRANDAAGRCVWLSSLSPRRDDWPQMLDALGQLYVEGVDPDWEAFDAPYAPRRITLPTYPFQRQPCWVETPRRGGAVSQNAGVKTPASSEQLYRVDWERKEASDGERTAEQLAGSWLVLADRGGLGAKLVRRLEEGGAQVAVAYRENGHGVSQLPGDLAEYNIAYLWGLDEKPDAAAPLESVLRATSGAVRLLRSLVAAGRPKARGLWLITRQAHAVQGETIEPGQRPLWSLGGAIANEHPEVNCRRIDIGADGDPHLAERLLAEMAHGGAEFQVAYRHGRRHVARLVGAGTEAGVSAASINKVRADCCYVVTGGLGGLGLEVARWLVRLGARDLVLAGRRKPQPHALAVIAELEAMGARISAWSADVTREADVESLLNGIANRGAEFSGVVHAAGDPGHGALLQHDEASLAQSIAPKVAGAWNLHRFTRELPLDFFVCFSSISAVDLGAPGQGGYAAANGYMDALMEARRSSGLAGLSVKWGLWAEVGLVSRMSAAEQARVLKSGIQPIRTADALDALGRLAFEADTAYDIVMPADWGVLLEALPSAQQAFFDAFRKQNGPEFVRTAPFVEEIQKLPSTERRSYLVEHVRGQIAHVLGLGSPEEVGLHDKLFDLGLDSLMAVELKNLLQASLGCKLLPTLLFDRPTAKSLADYLAIEVLRLPSEQCPSPEIQQEREAEILSSVASLSEEEAELLLLKELEEDSAAPAPNGGAHAYRA